MGDGRRNEEALNRLFGHEDEHYMLHVKISYPRYKKGIILIGDKKRMVRNIPHFYDGEMMELNGVNGSGLGSEVSFNPAKGALRYYTEYTIGSVSPLLFEKYCSFLRLGKHPRLRITAGHELPYAYALQKEGFQGAPRFL